MFLMHTSGHNWGGDFSLYIMQAMGIVQGTTDSVIRANFFTSGGGNFGPIVYPWGFPILLAPVFNAYGLSMPAFKVYEAVFYILFLFTIYKGYAYTHSLKHRLLLLSLFAFNPILLRFSDNVLSDIPFLFFSTLTVFFIGQTVVRKEIVFSRVIDALLLGVLIFCASIIRTNGILLIVLLALVKCIDFVFFKPNAKAQIQGIKTIQPIINVICATIPFIVFFSLNILLEVALPDGSHSHLNYLNDVTLQTLTQNAIYYAYLPSEFFLARGKSLFSIIPFAVYGASLILFFFGIKSRLNRDYHIILYILLTLALYIIWPGTQGIRFIFPILPFFISIAFSGIDVIAVKFSHLFAQNRFKDVIHIILIAIVLVYSSASTYLAYSNIKNNRETTSGPYSRDAVQLFSFIKSNTSSTDVIIFFKPRVMRLYTDRNALRYNPNTPVSSSKNGEYFVLNKESETFDNYPFLNESAMVFDNSSFSVYQTSSLDTKTSF